MIGNSDDETNFTHVLLINKLQIFVKFLLTNHQLILCYQKLNISNNQVDFLVDFLAHY